VRGEEKGTRERGKTNFIPFAHIKMAEKRATRDQKARRV